jgi:hypothetical protein
MASPKIQIAPERIAEGRHLYETTRMALRHIATLMGISRQTLLRRIPEWGWTPRRAPRLMIDQTVVAITPGAIAIPPETRTALAARLQCTVERSLDAVDRVLEKVGPADEAGAERSSRTLAAVARTLHEMAAFTTPEEVTPPDDADDDPIPRDIDEFRRELTRRIGRFIEARRAGAARLLADPEGSLD